jgi:hypothetical protein
MNHDGEETIFPGSRGATHLVEWIDGVLADLHAGRVSDAEAALQAEQWRGLDLSGVPRPIANQMHETLQSAADALSGPHRSAADAEAALLMARSRFLPGG